LKGRNVELREGLSFAGEHFEGVLVTRRANGRPQLSNILYHLGRGGGSDDDPVVRISITDSRAKTRNLRRDHSASLYVPGATFWSYVVLDGTAELSPVAAATDDAVVDELAELYRSIRGEEHPDWAEYRQVMVAEQRLVVRLRPTHAYGAGQR
jgi:PPOX class probable F420-dependent enzyme